MTETIELQEVRRLAHRVREACIKAALDGYANAGVSGLCAEGRWEAAISGIEMLDVDATVAAALDSQRRGSGGH